MADTGSQVYLNYLLVGPSRSLASRNRAIRCLAPKHLVRRADHSHRRCYYYPQPARGLHAPLRTEGAGLRANGFSGFAGSSHLTARGPSGSPLNAGSDSVGLRLLLPFLTSSQVQPLLLCPGPHTFELQMR